MAVRSDILYFLSPIQRNNVPHPWSPGASCRGFAHSQGNTSGIDGIFYIYRRHCYCPGFRYFRLFEKKEYKIISFVIG